MTKSFSLYIPGIVAFVVLAVGFVVANAVFTSPTLPPPGGNVPAPLNVGPADQTKTGGLLQVFNLWVNSALGVTGGATFSGNVGIGTAAPTRALDIGGDAILGFKGAEKVSNRNFSTHTPAVCNGWTRGVDWTCDTTNNEADNTGAGITTLTQNTTEVAGEIYEVIFTVKNRTVGSVTMSVGGVSGTVRSDNAAFFEVLTATGPGDLTFTPTGPFDGSIDDVSVKRLTRGDLFAAGTITATKLTVGTIDPVYEIDGKKYATYVSDVAGGVKTEVTGTIKCQISPIRQAQGKCQYVIDFDEQKAGSDLWLFWETSTKNVGDIAVLLTPGFEGNIWYEKIPSENKIIMRSNQNGEVSFRLTAPRKDAAQWPNEITE